MARERRSPEEIVAKLRQVEALRLRGKTCAEVAQSIGGLDRGFQPVGSLASPRTHLTSVQANASRLANRDRLENWGFSTKSVEGGRSPTEE